MSTCPATPWLATLGQLLSGLSFRFLTCHARCRVRICTEVLYKLLPTVQLDYDLLYRLHCYSKKPQTQVHARERFISHSSPDLVGPLCSP